MGPTIHFENNEDGVEKTDEVKQHSNKKMYNLYKGNPEKSMDFSEKYRLGLKSLHLGSLTGKYLDDFEIRRKQCITLQ